MIPKNLKIEEMKNLLNELEENIFHIIYNFEEWKKSTISPFLKKFTHFLPEEYKSYAD